MTQILRTNEDKYENSPSNQITQIVCTQIRTGGLYAQFDEDDPMEVTVIFDNADATISLNGNPKLNELSHITFVCNEKKFRLFIKND